MFTERPPTRRSTPRSRAKIGAALTALLQAAARTMLGLVMDGLRYRA